MQSNTYNLSTLHIIYNNHIETGYNNILLYILKKLKSISVFRSQYYVHNVYRSNRKRFRDKLSLRRKKTVTVFVILDSQYA